LSICPVRVVVIGTARIVCAAGSMQLSSVRPSVCPSVPPGRRTPLLRVCCRWLGGQGMSIDCYTSGGQLQQPRRGSRCGERQCHTEAGSRPNTDSCCSFCCTAADNATAAAAAAAEQCIIRYRHAGSKHAMLCLRILLWYRAHAFPHYLS